MTFLDRLLNRQPARKAVTGPGVAIYSNQPLLSSLWGNPQDVAKKCLEAYKVGWFYKAESRISRDFASLAFTLAYEDTEGDNEEPVVAPRASLPFESLSPEEQFLRLWEHPNPYQTGRQLRQKTMIRLDMAGTAFVFMEGGDGGGLPTGLYGISPARMWPSYGNDGRLIGWVMDKDSPSGIGVPFTTDEIIAITYSGADDSEFGVGVVEAVYAEVPLSGQIARHTSDVLSTGGRLAGMLWPKDRALSEDEYVDAQRAWRNVASDPNAARRMLLFPEPMEYAAGASTPAEIGIPELATLNRDTILTAFPIHPYMVGVPLASGLNSGESLRYVRREYWEGTIHPRAETWEDAIQQSMLPRYEAATGRALDFDIEEPSLDDAAAVIEKVGALRGLLDIGFDTKEAIAAVGLDHIEWLGAPAPAEPVPVDEAEAPVTPPAIPPVVTKAARMREDILGETYPGFTAELTAALEKQRDRIATEIERVFGPLTKTARKDLPTDWWDAKREDEFLRNRLRGLYVRLAREALTTVSNAVDRIVYPRSIEQLTDTVLASAGKQITAINERTRQAVTGQLRLGVQRGYSIAQLVNGVVAEGFPGLAGAPLENGIAAFDAARAEVIARTETMRAYNESAIRGYGSFGVTQLLAIDGDFDDVCEARNGQTFSVDDALAESALEHPNGTLDWAPLSDKSAHDVREDQMAQLIVLATKAIERGQPAPVVNFYPGSPEVKVYPADPPTVNVSVPEQPAPSVVVNVPEQAPPVVNVPEQAAPVVNVAAAEAPVVNVNVPEQPAPVVNVKAADPPVVNVAAPELRPIINVEAAKAGDVIVNTPDTIRITEMPARVTTRKVTKRDNGSIAETVEVEEDVS